MTQLLVPAQREALTLSDRKAIFVAQPPRANRIRPHLGHAAGCHR